MNNEPVAWAIKVGKDLIEIVDEMRDFQELVDFYKLEQWDFEEVPLYTHPAELTLTEDEIDDVWAACSTGESDTIDMHLFAEAILKKAQEK